LKIIHSKKVDPEERLLCSGNENLETKIKSPFRIGKSIIQKNYFEKKNPETYSEKGDSECIFICILFF